MQGFGDSFEHDCKTLLGLLIEVSRSLRGHTPEDRRLVDSEPLAAKVIYHASSILFLLGGTPLHDRPQAPVRIVDHASIKVLTRALLESVWAFDHVFVDPKTEDEFTFRYSSWMLAGFVQRQKYPALTDSATRQLENDRQANDHYRQQLQGTNTFAELGARQRERALNGQLWRPSSLRATATAFLGKRFGATLYSWLSSYQHGDALSAIQIRETRSYQDQRDAAESSLVLVAVSLAQMIKAYVRLWPQLEAVTGRHPNIGLVEMYTHLFQSEPDID